MNRKMIVTVASVLFLIGSVSTMAWTADGPGRGRQTGPPPEAVEACTDKSEGAEVEFTNRRGEKVKAVCEQIEGRLAAVPEGGFSGPYGRKGRKGPFPEALEACKGSAEGASVEFTNRRGKTVKAICRLVAVPEFRGQRGTPPGGTGSPEQGGTVNR